MCVIFSIIFRLTIALAKVICINLFLPPQHTIQSNARVLVSDIFMNGNHLLPINGKNPKTMKIKREKKIKRTKGKESSEKRNYAIEKKYWREEKTVLQNSNEQNDTKRYKDIWLHGFPFFCLIRSFVRVSFIYCEVCDWFIYELLRYAVYIKHLNEYILKMLIFFLDTSHRSHQLHSHSNFRWIFRCHSFNLFLVS